MPTRASWLLHHLMLGPVLWGDYNYPCFTDEKTEARREVHDLPEVTQQVSGQTEIQTQVCFKNIFLKISESCYLAQGLHLGCGVGDG